MKMRRLICIILYACAVSTPGGAEALSASDSNWESAAQNRDYAARFHAAQALSFLSTADALRDAEFTDDSDRRKRFIKAGDLEMNAGALFVRAAINYKKAADNWAKATAQLRGRGARPSGKDFDVNKEEFLASARHVCYLGAQAYERAAGAYGSGNADAFKKAGTASERAAECRESIANNSFVVVVSP